MQLKKTQFLFINITVIFYLLVFLLLRFVFWFWQLTFKLLFFVSETRFTPLPDSNPDLSLEPRPTRKMSLPPVVRHDVVVPFLYLFHDIFFLFSRVPLFIYFSPVLILYLKFPITPC